MKRQSRRNDAKECRSSGLAGDDAQFGRGLARPALACKAALAEKTGLGGKPDRARRRI
ncbi:hypothetical protein [Roseibium denhamense]|uniref:hypothetical protein n=1 Tax=Roseibium denhamense TaxID=76305 RepID=UPI0012BB8D16|nr:hypothetical protein [Roseibium denhamense]